MKKVFWDGVRPVLFTLRWKILGYLKYNISDIISYIFIKIYIIMNSMQKDVDIDFKITFTNLSIPC